MRRDKTGAHVSICGIFASVAHFKREIGQTVPETAALCEGIVR